MKNLLCITLTALLLLCGCIQILRHKPRPVAIAAVSAMMMPAKRMFVK